MSALTTRIRDLNLGTVCHEYNINIDIVPESLNLPDHVQDVVAALHPIHKIAHGHFTEHLVIMAACQRDMNIGDRSYVGIYSRCIGKVSVKPHLKNIIINNAHHILTSHSDTLDDMVDSLVEILPKREQRIIISPAFTDHARGDLIIDDTLIEIKAGVQPRDLVILQLLGYVALAKLYGINKIISINTLQNEIIRLDLTEWESADRARFGRDLNFNKPVYLLHPTQPVI